MFKIARTIRGIFKRYWLIIVLAIILVVWLLVRDTAGAPAGHASTQTKKQAELNQQTTTPQPPAFDKQQYSIDDPASPWIVVNKHRPLKPVDYAPPLTVPNVPLRLTGVSSEMHVSTQMAPALEQLFAGAKQDGLLLMVASGYRSYQVQVSVYNAEVKNYGKTQADRESARPGSSEHQTGLAADLEPASRQCEVAACFGDTPEGKWVAANAYKYGFIIRYFDGSEPITGYTYEPWHVRYVGKELATEIHNLNNQPLETFFSLGAAPDYQ